MNRLTSPVVFLALLLAMVLMPILAHADNVVVGVNLLNAPDKLTPDEQESILNAMQAAGVRVIRMGIDVDRNGDEKGINFAERVYAHGIKIDWLVNLQWPKGTKAPTPPPGMGLWRNPPLSTSDPDSFRAYFQSMLGKLESKGIVLAGFELGNEINFTANADFPLPGKGKIFGLDDLYHDPEGQQIARGFTQYMKSLAVLKDIRDHSKLNQHTPIISAGLAIGNNPPGPSWDKRVDGVAINATLEFLRVNGLDHLVDYYGVHTYPPGNGPGTNQGAANRLSRLENIVFTECRPAGSSSGKPCWLTEWGFGAAGNSCPVDDSYRTTLVREVRDDFAQFAQQGRLKAIFYYTWQGQIHAPKEDRFGAFLCGALTESGRLAISPM